MKTFTYWTALLLAFSIFAQELPPGVPKVILEDGTIDVPIMFSSGAYQQEAFRLLLQEANVIARQLCLSERLPVTEEDVVFRFISPFGFDYSYKRLGNITTAKYVYSAEHENKLSCVTVAKYDDTCVGLCKRGRRPLRAFDPQTPYELATQWLAAASMDIGALNRDCRAHVDVSPFWNDLRKLGEKPKRSGFFPMYSVWWESQQAGSNVVRVPAFVELYLPKRMLVELRVENSVYIKRAPLVPTNLSSLFPGSYPTERCP